MSGPNSDLDKTNGLLRRGQKVYVYNMLVIASWQYPPRNFFWTPHFKFYLAAIATSFCNSSTAWIILQGRSPGFLFFCVTLGRDVFQFLVYIHVTEGVIKTPFCLPHRVTGKIIQNNNGCDWSWQSQLSADVKGQTWVSLPRAGIMKRRAISVDKLFFNHSQPNKQMENISII